MTVADESQGIDPAETRVSGRLPPVASEAPFQPWRYLYRLPLLTLWLVSLPVLFIALLPPIRRLPLGKRPLGGWVQQGYARALTRILGLRLEIHGRLPPAPFLLAANHISWFDIVLLHALAPMWLVAKSDIRRWPLIGALAFSAGTIFIERGHDGSRRRTARRMAAILRQGQIVGLFPEAGIRPGRGVDRFHARLFGAAQRAGVPILPVAIRYWRDGDAHEERVFGPGDSLFGLAFSNLARPVCRGQLIIGSLLPGQAARNAVAREAEAEVRRLYGTIHD